MALVVWDREDVQKELTSKVDELGGVGAAAKAWGVSQGYLSHVLNGDRRPGAVILRHLGLQKFSGYVREEANA
jgi:hypothetical protein